MLSKAHVHRKGIARLCCWFEEKLLYFDWVMFGFSISAKFNAAGNVFWLNMAL